ncbi:MAG: carbon-nitrogen hydrolase family protein [bacterium]
MEIITEKQTFTGREPDRLRVALAQMSPILLNRAATLNKVMKAVEEAAGHGAGLVCFGEALVPGYPFWVERLEGAVFESKQQKEYYALYLEQGVVLERGDLAPVCQLAKRHKIAVYLGIMERASDRGGHSLYASLVFINEQGHIKSVHRKLQPTYEERLVWAQGDGHGLRAHPIGPFRAGGLNCWENWLPLARAALYGQGVNLHVSVWPGGDHNTKDLPRFIAQEGRSYVIAVSGLMPESKIPADLPGAAALTGKDGWLANGASAICGPDGQWVIEPVIGKEALLIADLDMEQIRRARHNLDIAGHYSRPDVTRLQVNRQRQSTVEFINED